MLSVLRHRHRPFVLNQNESLGFAAATAGAATGAAAAGAAVAAAAAAAAAVSTAVSLVLLAILNHELFFFVNMFQFW